MSRSDRHFPVFVNHIAASVKVADLRKVFEAALVGRQKVTEVTIVDSHGFVVFEDSRDAERAIDRFNGYEMRGRRLHVDYSQELEEFLWRMKRVRVRYTQDPEAEGRRSRSRIRSRSRGRSPSFRRSRSRERVRSPSLRRRSRSRERVRSPLIRERSRSRERVRSPSKRRRSQSPSIKRMLHSRSRSRSRKSKSNPRSRSRSTSRKRKLSDNSRSRSRSKSPKKKKKKSKSKKDSKKKKKKSKKRSSRSVSESSEKKEENGLTDEEESNKEDDLREMLSRRKNTIDNDVDEEKSVPLPPKIEIKLASGDKNIQVKKENVFDSTNKTVLPTFQYLTVGNLLNEVEPDDIKLLFEEFGVVDSVTMKETFAEVKVECSRETARKAIDSLNQSLWMDNNISVQFDFTKPENAALIKEELMKKSKKEDKEVNKPQIVKRPKLDKKSKSRILVIYAENRPKSFVTDMNDIFSRYGIVDSCTASANKRTVTVSLTSNERQALNCIEETNQISYKGDRLRVKFLLGSEEDSLEYRKLHPVEYRCYPDVLITSNEANAQEKKEPDLPIGVLPSSSSLGAFGATPNADILSSIIKNVQSRMGQAEDKDKWLKFESESKEVTSVQPQPKPLTEDPNYLTSVEGEIQSIHHKIVLVHFYTGYSFQTARLIPGQMYVNGKVCLGFLIKKKTFHSWPKAIKDFLYVGSKIKMDVRKMDESEIAEVTELSSERVNYSTSLMWKIRKPDETDLKVSLSRNQSEREIVKACVTKLYPKWGILSRFINSVRKDIFFQVHQFFGRTSLLEKTDSLLNYLTVGDVVGVQCQDMDYLELAEIVRSSPGFQGSMDTIGCFASYVWPIETEFDPFSHREELISDSVQSCEFLTTSSILNRPLPNPESKNVQMYPGVIQEVHLPAGGIILIDESMGLPSEQRHVYFHRSRVFVNGVKVTSTTPLDEEIVPGDPVTVEVVENNPATPYVFSPVSWVAVSVQLASRSRGARIASDLRKAKQEREDNALYEARVISFHRPADPLEPVSCGTIVLDSGPYTGQRVDFDRTLAYAFGYALTKADLSKILGYGDSVLVRLKPYNSYLIETVSVGFESTNLREDLLAHNSAFKIYLANHGLDLAEFKQIVKGETTPRPFLPLAGPLFKGKVVEMSTTEKIGCDELEVEADLGAGDVLRVMVPREAVFVFGHWMGKADLKYVIEKNDEIYFEYTPLLTSSPSTDPTTSTFTPRRATLAWPSGDPECRPRFVGSSAQCYITQKMDEALWHFVRKRNLDETLFRALVEGRLPPKRFDPKVTPEPSTSTPTVEIDEETLSEAALLKEMKAKLGSTNALKAMMMLMTKVKDEKDVEELLGKMNENGKDEVSSSGQKENS